MEDPRPGGTSPQEMPTTPVAGRVYSGRQPSERTVERHDRLVDAGIEIFGTVGYAGAKIKLLCQQAALSERYFYESFGSKEALLVEVYDALSNQLMHHVVDALRRPSLGLRESVRAGLAAVVNFMLDDPRHARIILVEAVGISSELETKRHQSMTAFAAQSMNQLLLLSGIDHEEAYEQLAQNPDDAVVAMILDATRLTAVSMVGGVNNMLLDAVLGGTTSNTERITDVALQLLCSASTGIRTLAAEN